MKKLVPTLLAVPLVLVACSKTAGTAATSRVSESTTTQTPQIPSPSGPPDTSAAAAPTNARYACEYLIAAVDQLSSNDQSVGQAVALATSGVNSTLDASAHDSAYKRLRADADAFLANVVRLQLQLELDGKIVHASKYPASYRETVKAVQADCS